MRNVIELERRAGELTEDVRDVLHAAALNLGAIVVEARSKDCGSLMRQFHYLQELLGNLEKLLDQRPHLHMGFLITRQIQQQEEAVRTERLADYEEKIYDQRRIIADKEGFFQSLLRPRKKRPAEQTAEEFQETRARERDQEDRAKTDLLTRELADITTLRKAIDTAKVLILKKNRSGMDSPRSETVATQVEFVTERTLGSYDRSNKENHQPHCRSGSLQMSFFRDQVKEEETEEGNLFQFIEEIKKNKQESRELHITHEQLGQMLRFKKVQVKNGQREYKTAEQNRKQAQSHLTSLKNARQYELFHCFQRVKAKRTYSP